MIWQKRPPSPSLSWLGRWTGIRRGEDLGRTSLDFRAYFCHSWFTVTRSYLGNIFSTSAARGCETISIQLDPAEINWAIVEDDVAMIEGFLTHDTPTRWMTSFAITRPVSTTWWTSAVMTPYILNHELLHEICRLAFQYSGDYCLNYGSVHKKWPGTSKQNWRRDQPKYPLVKEGPDAPEGMLNFFTASADFDANPIYFGQQRRGGTWGARCTRCWSSN